jgi:hypothetical protein
MVHIKMAPNVDAGAPWIVNATVLAPAIVVVKTLATGAAEITTADGISSSVLMEPRISLDDM